MLSPAEGVGWPTHRKAPVLCGSCVAASGLLEDRAAIGTPWNKEGKVQGSQSVSRYWYGSDFHKTLPTCLCVLLVRVSVPAS